MKLIFMPATKDHGWYFKNSDDGRVVMAQGQPVPLAVAEEIAGCLQAGWQLWAGGDMPDAAIGQRVDVQLRDGEILQDQPSAFTDWQHEHASDSDNVVFWRVTTLHQLSNSQSTANGWHDIDAAQMAKTDQDSKIEWPDESDYDPTRVMGGVHNPAKVTTDGVEP